MNLSNITTTKDAVDYIHHLFATQLERSIDENTPPNTSADGDGQAKAAFLTLLPPEEQRKIFLKFCGSRSFWPRIRTLVGIPPYTFLLPEDSTILNATGIATGRTNMAYDLARPSSYFDFGHGHFHDGANRLYKLIARRRKSDGAIFNDLIEGDVLVLDIRLPRMSQKRKLELIKQSSISSAGILFPRSGDRLRLVPVPMLKAAPSELALHLERVHQRDSKSAVARLVATVLSTSF